MQWRVTLPPKRWPLSGDSSAVFAQPMVEPQSPPVPQRANSKGSDRPPDYSRADRVSKRHVNLDLRCPPEQKHSSEPWGPSGRRTNSHKTT